MVGTRVNLRFFYLNKCSDTWQVTVVSHVKLTFVVKVDLTTGTKLNLLKN